MIKLDKKWAQSGTNKNWEWGWRNENLQGKSKEALDRTAKVQEGNWTKIFAEKSSKLTLDNDNTSVVVLSWCSMNIILKSVLPTNRKKIYNLNSKVWSETTFSTATDLLQIWATP